MFRPISVALGLGLVILWIAALSVLVLVEKIAPLGRIAAMVAGVAFAGAGIWLLLT